MAGSVMLVMVVILIWFTYRLNNLKGDGIRWDERLVTWQDFQLADQVFEDYDANISSEIVSPSRFSSDKNLVFAIMYPEYSNRTSDAHTSEQLLIHEQYHFNITEYHARLLRKKLVDRGEKQLSPSNIKYYLNDINDRLIQMQEDYDNESDHNGETEGQRYWELKIDDLLRQTAYYANPDLESYYNFRKPETRFYRKIYSTVRQKILKSYPALASDTLNGISYEVIERKNQTIVKHRNNGALEIGGDLNAAITVIDYNDTQTVLHFLDKDSIPIKDRNYTKLVIDSPEDATMISTYYNTEGKRTHGSYEGNPQTNVYKKVWKYSKDLSQAKVTFLDLNDKPTFLDNHIYKYVRDFDTLGRSIGIIQLDINGKMRMDQDFSAAYKYSYDENNNMTRLRLYDENNDFVTQVLASNLSYEFDSRGNVISRKTLDKEGQPAIDNNGVSSYEYNYDNRDNLTSVKRFNTINKPTLDAGNVFQEITDYDKQDRLIFKADYYPKYVLKFNDNLVGATHIKYLADSLKVTYNKDGYNYTFAANDSIAITKEYLNKKGNVEKRSYLNSEEKPAQMEDHAVSFIMQYDDRGNLLLEKGLDSLGATFTRSNNVASIAYEYDINNNKTKVTYLDKADAPVNSDTGEAIIVYKYNDKNLLLEKRNYNTNNEPVLVDDAYKTTYEHNRFDKDSIIKQYNTANTLKSRIALTRLFYNKYGNQIKETYHTASGNRTVNFSGVSRIDFVFDDRQANIGTRYYNTTDRLQNNSQGYAIIKKKLNDCNFVKEESYFNSRNQPVNGEMGYHKATYKWNEMGVTSVNTTYDKYGNLWENDNGIAIYKFDYFPSIMDSVVTFYDRKNELTEDLDGIAKITYLKTMNALYYTDLEYDKTGKLLNALEPMDTSEFEVDLDTMPKTQFSVKLDELQELINEELSDESN